MARMYRRTRIVMLALASSLGTHCAAQSVAHPPCSHEAVTEAAAKVVAVQQELRLNKVDDMEEEVSPAIADQMMRLKEALSAVSDAAMACAQPGIESSALQRNLIQAIHANGPLPDETGSMSATDPRYPEEYGAYGHNLLVGVSRPKGFPSLLEITYSINIECGDDTVLLVYELRDGAWKQRIRWQSPPLKEISDAFGDGLLTAIVTRPQPVASGKPDWRIAVEHGTPWCTSRFSNFKMDLLAPESDPARPQVLWHINRDYSRFDFESSLKSSGNIFELRLNADNMDLDPSNGFERRVIYRYELDAEDHLRRIGPMGIHARGFVHEWLSAPWEESSGLVEATSDLATVAGLKTAHEKFDPPMKKDAKDYFRNQYGPVRACKVAGVFQVEIDSSLETFATDTEKDKSKPLTSHYYHVREGKDGYVMVSAPTVADPDCVGKDLMATTSNSGSSSK